MPTIACLGWGSLIWDSRELPIHRKWHGDGPFMKLEFARHSKDGRITLVIVDQADSISVRTLWAVMQVPDLAAAKEALCLREGTKPDRIGGWQNGGDILPAIPSIADWSKTSGVDAVVWTALPPRIDEQERTPSESEVISYLAGLRGAARDNAERYVRLAPRQIDTPYRRRIEAEFGWTALDKWPADGS